MDELQHRLTKDGADMTMVRLWLDYGLNLCYLDRGPPRLW